MYRIDSVGLFGFPNRPLRWLRSISQSTALRMFSAYLPSRILLPSINSAVPHSAVMVVGYEPPLPDQWPSRCCCLATYSRPFCTTTRYLSGSASVLATPTPAKRTAADKLVAVSVFIVAFLRTLDCRRLLGWRVADHRPARRNWSHLTGPLVVPNLRSRCPRSERLFGKCVANVVDEPNSIAD